MKMRTALRRVALAAGALALGGSLAAAPAHAAEHPSHALARQAASPLGGLTLRQQSVPASAMPAAVRASMKAAHPTATSNTLIVVQLASYGYANPAMCVDANSYGPSAGLNGDIVQLWGCFNDLTNHPNQWWLPLQSSYGETELVNWQYGLCLDADSSHGFVDGAQVQLWSCFHDEAGHPNQWWGFGPDGRASLLSLVWGNGAKVLDANDYGPTAGSNGDKIQIWTYLGGLNQIWWQ